MNISSNKSMVSFNGLDNLTYLSELYISDNNFMTDLSGLETVSGMYWLVVGESKGLTSLNGLNNLLTVTNFIIRTNPLLTDLSGLENLTNIGWFSVSDNAELTSFSGLGESGEGQRIGANKRVATLQIGGLSITNNPKLATCAIPAVCDFVNTNSATISGNAPGCESQAAVQTACRSLPVTLTYFKVSAENQTAVLQWATAEEKNSSSFEIEHSKDSKTWKKVGEQVATGESNKPIEYHFVHSVSESGLHYYRLKMLDSDHTFSYSKIQSVKFSGSDENSLFLYPNPATDEFFVGKKADLIKIRIVDMQGKMVYETHNIPSAGLSVKKLAAGTYQVHMTKMNGVTQTERIVIF